ncbi:DUF3558 domain-containing protein [Gordonia sp. zg691]|uniref:DUF3558 domain-containing protein n=1 Tax=Gordonia jinghuaiqii TaxID=2758710 RepID=UPI0016626B48|nr:DUF3558 domain-containing protein [Gordonia jinghuaiqii]MBD0862474.1 DUF3558 domain-containing protein [Gordonia jinghuaiqii]
MPSSATPRHLFAVTASLICLWSTAVACATVPGDPVQTLRAGSTTPTDSPAPSSPSLRQTDDAGRVLPFENTFPNRWSINNDGSTYEPCTEIPADVIRSFGLDPGSVSDVAASDFQTARGCEWTLREDRRSTISQFVGNILRPEGGLTGHKELNRAGTTWYPDTEVDGRRVLVESMMPGDCTVYIRSGDAVVITSVTKSGFARPPVDELCKTAISFLQATVRQIPS